MTEQQMNERLTEILDDSDSNKREFERITRRVRRKNERKKFKSRYYTITDTGHIMKGYVDCDYTSEEAQLVFCGKYIKFRKSSNEKKWCKTTSNHLVRKRSDLSNGNYYRKVFRYFWWYLD